MAQATTVYNFKNLLGVPRMIGTGTIMGMVLEGKDEWKGNGGKEGGIEREKR